jgi:hypothetical protein
VKDTTVVRPNEIAKEITYNIMPKKQLAVSSGNGTISRREKGKKNKRFRNERKKDDDPKEIRSSNSRQSADSKQVKTAMWWFLVGGVVVFVAVLCQHYNKDQRPPSPNTDDRKTSLSELFRIGCKSTRLVHCERGVFEIQDETRSIRARPKPDRQEFLLRAGQKLLEIPRSVQITTIDALRDPRVNRLLRKNPRHRSTGRPLRPKAFLAVYMAFELSRMKGTDIVSSNESDVLSSVKRFQRAYLQYLPTHQDFVQHHPISRHINTHSDSPLPTSLTDHLVDQYFRSILSEYHAFCRFSSDFKTHVPLEDWITVRLIVNTRSFKSAPLAENDISDRELESYRPFLQHDGTGKDGEHSDNIDLLRSSFYDSCRSSWMRSCMVPLFDSFNHHTTPNMGWKFMEHQSPVSESKSFIMFAAKEIASGSNLYVSYGSMRPVPMIFAQYGFVNPDHSGKRAALLAPYHRLLDEAFEIEESSHRDTALRKYLSFRDGYKSCRATTPEDAERLAFERAKFEALEAISNILDSWVAILPPKAESGGDGDETQEEEEDQLSKVLSMCRLLATTHRDYGGRSTELLSTVARAKNPEHYQFRSSSDEATSEGLEYRAWHVLERLAGLMRSRALRSLVSFAAAPHADADLDAPNGNSNNHWATEAEVRRKLYSNELDPTTPEGATAFVLLGELETLTILSDRAKQKKETFLSNKQWRSKNGQTVNEEDYIVRLHPCE